MADGSDTATAGHQVAGGHAPVGADPRASRLVADGPRSSTGSRTTSAAPFAGYTASGPGRSSTSRVLGALWRYFDLGPAGATRRGARSEAGRRGRPLVRGAFASTTPTSSRAIGPTPTSPLSPRNEDGTAAPDLRRAAGRWPVRWRPGSAGSGSAPATGSRRCCPNGPRQPSRPSSERPASARSCRHAPPSSASRSMVDRFGQIEPKVLFVADSYRYGGKQFELADKAPASPARSRARCAGLVPAGPGARGARRPHALMWQS